MSTIAVNRADLDVLSSLLRARGNNVELFHFRYDYGLEAPYLAASVERLRKLGCIIEPVGHGYRLSRTALPVWDDYLRAALRENGTPRAIEVYRRTSSTQDLIKSRAHEHIAIFADEQTAGRGRFGRTWVTPPGLSLLFSMTHPINEHRHESPDRITFIVAVAVAQVMERLTREKLVQIKWPNDVMASGRKLAGILVEVVPTSAGRVAVIGIGINVHQTATDLLTYPAELRERITSMTMLGSTSDRLHVATEVITRIDSHLASRNDRLLLDEWRVRNLMQAQRVTLLNGGQTIIGEVLDLDPELGLILRRDSGEITHLPAATTTVVV